MRYGAGLVGLSAMLALLGSSFAAGPSDPAQTTQWRTSPQPTVRLTAPNAVDQDDLCIWRHPEHPELSTVIAADKKANRLFVYDLGGQLLQEVSVPQPGNIDIRSGFPLGADAIDLVVVNQRGDEPQLQAFRVRIETRELVRVDRGDLMTGPNYGGCLYRSARSNRYYFFTTSKENGIQQFELADDGAGKVQSRKVRSIPGNKCEGAVADDERGELYVGIEQLGILRLPAEADGDTTGKLVVAVGQHGIRGDIEGLAISHAPQRQSELIFSDQGTSTFYRLALMPCGVPRPFTINGARETDGIDLLVQPLGPAFPHGIFGCHTDEGHRPVLLTPVELADPAAAP